MTDEEVQRAMEEETPVAIQWHDGRKCVGVVVGITLDSVQGRDLWLPPGTVWAVRVEGLRLFRHVVSNCLRVATAEELLLLDD